MLDVNEVIEIEDNLNALGIEARKLDFTIQNALNEVEETKSFLIENGFLDVLAKVNLDRIYNYLDIALDYKQTIQNFQKEAKALTVKVVNELKEEA